MGLVSEYSFSDHSKEVIEAMEEQVEQWLEAVGEDAAGTAADVCPVGTPESTGIKGYIGGTLRNSISAVTQEWQSDFNKHDGAQASVADVMPQDKPEKNAVYIGTNVEYAPYQEFGTSKGIKGKHFIQFGMTAHQQAYKDLLEQYLKQ